MSCRFLQVCLMKVKVSEYIKKFFFKLYCPKKRTKIDKILPYEAGPDLSNISFVFWAMEFQEKMLLRFTDL